ncbi:hypothetical protein PI124_g20207, partial [Phytophthora idaei]
MDVILSRAGLSAAQQRTLCFDAVKDEVKQTEVKLTDAIASLKRLQDVVRVARDVHNAQRYSTEDEDEEQTSLPVNHERARRQYVDPPSSGPYRASGLGSSGGVMNPRKGDPASAPAPSFFRRANSSYDIASDGVTSGIRHVGQKRRATNVSLPPPVAHSFLRPTTTADLVIRRELERQSIWPRHHQYQLLHSRPRSPVQQSEKKVAQVIDGLEKRLSKLSGEEQDDVVSTSIKSALKVARLAQIKGEEASVQVAVNNARAAASEFLDRDSSSSDIFDRLEDLRQILAVVVRAALETDGKLEGSGLRDLFNLLKNLQDTFPGSAARFKWCSTQLRKFITQKYKRPAQISVVDQEKLSSVVAEARGWESVNDYSASRFGDIMTFVTEILGGSYE